MESKEFLTYPFSMQPKSQLAKREVVEFPKKSQFPILSPPRPVVFDEEKTKAAFAISSKVCKSPPSESIIIPSAADHVLEQLSKLKEREANLERREESVRQKEEELAKMQVRLDSEKVNISRMQKDINMQRDKLEMAELEYAKKQEQVTAMKDKLQEKMDKFWKERSDFDEKASKIELKMACFEEDKRMKEEELADKQRVIEEGLKSLNREKSRLELLLNDNSTSTSVPKLTAQLF
jgi:chromosome segregation ATPase